MGGEGQWNVHGEAEVGIAGRFQVVATEVFKCHCSSLMVFQILQRRCHTELLCILRILRRLAVSVSM